MKRSVKLLSAVCLFLLAAVIASCNDTEQPTEGFTVTWVNYDGTVLEVDRDVPVNTVPEYNGTAPKRKCEGKYGFGFSGWSPAVEAVTGNRTYVAQYDVNPHRTVNVIWKNEDGNVLKNAELPYEEDYKYDGETPKTENDLVYRYDFDGWEKEEQDDGNTVIYTAQYKTANASFTVTYVDLKGKKIGQFTHIRYAELASDMHRKMGAQKTRPNKEADSNGLYEFAGWEPEIEYIMEDVTFTPVFKPKSFFVLSADQKTLTGILYEAWVSTEITEAVVPDGVEVIASEAFGHSAGSFDKIILPDSVKIIETGAFSNYNGLIVIPAGVSEIAVGAFKNSRCEFVLDENNLYYKCIDGALVERKTGKLISVGTCSGIPDSSLCRIICEFSFPDSYNSNPLYIPSWIKEIEPGAIRFGGNSRSILVDAWNDTLHSAGNCVINTAEKRLILGGRAGEIPDDGSVTVIGNSAFAYCFTLHELNIPGTVTEIEEKAFYGADQLYEVSIGDGLEIIGPEAFAHCINLKQITIPKTVKYIDPTAFDGLWEKLDVVFYGTQEQWNELTKDFGEKLNDIFVIILG